jgi:hypothetical protein
VHYSINSRLADIARSPRAAAVVDRFVPGLLSRPELRQWGGLPVRVFAERQYAAADALDQLAVLDGELAGIEVVAEAAAEETLLCPRPDYEAGDVPEGSAQAVVPDGGRAWEPVEIRLSGPSHGNPFTDVEFTARFTLNGAAAVVGGFYDGEGQWVARFLPAAPGTLRFTTSSTARSLHGVSGSVEIGPARGHGPGPRRRLPLRARRRDPLPPARHHRLRLDAPAAAGARGHAADARRRPFQQAADVRLPQVVHLLRR